VGRVKGSHLFSGGGDRRRPRGRRELLRSARLIDLYEGEYVPAGRKSMILSLRFQVPERTLKQEEVQPVMR
jgi:phenylalanyl-tRNA synthetase beta subunit